MQEKLEKQLDPLWLSCREWQGHISTSTAGLAFSKYNLQRLFSLFDDGYIEMFESGDAVR